MTNPVVLVERPAEGVALLRINRPDARNALNMEVRKTIAKHLTELAEDSAVRCIVLTGIAGESAKFGQPEVKIGIIPGGGGTQRLTSAVGKYKAMRYILTGDIFSARQAYEMGLASEIVPDGEVEMRAVEMAQQIAELPPLAIGQAKEAVLRGMDAALDTGLALESKANQIPFSSQDQKEGMAAFIEKRKAKFIGK